MRALFLVFAAIIACIFSYPKEEIAQWRGPYRNGIYPEKNLLKVWPVEGPKLLWKFEGLGLGHSSASVISDRIFTSGTIDSITYIFSFDLNGTLIWRKPLGKEWMQSFPGTRSTPLIYGDKGYLMTGMGQIYCFNAIDGAVIWLKDLFKDFDGQNIMHGVTENLVIDGDKLFCTPGGKKSNVVALNKDTGTKIWESSGLGYISSDCSPIIIERGGKKYLINLTSNTVLALEIESGKLAWNFDLCYEWKFHASSPVYKDGYLFVIDGFGEGNSMLKIAEDGKSFEKIWADTLLEDYLGNVVLLGDRIYGGARHKADAWFCLDWKTGKKIYSKKILDPGSIVSADGMLYCFAYNGVLGLVKPTQEGFELVSSFQVGGKKNDHWTPVVIKDGRLYVRYSNTLYVYNVAT